jgi:hypothetical protein
MEKTYQQQALSFALKTVIGLGTVYVITEKFIGQIDHLFHLESIWTALFIFFLIYFVTPIAVVCGYFFIKKDSVSLMESKTNLIIGWMAAAYLVAMVLAFFVHVGIFLVIGGVLMLFALSFLGWSSFQYKPNEHSKTSLPYLVIGYGILIFAFLYLIRNDRHARDYECQYFSDEVKHFQAMNVVNDYESSSANIFRPGSPDTLNTDVLRSYLAINSSLEDKQKLPKSKRDELLRLTKNRWGLYINILSYKALLALLPFMALLIGLIFLYTTHEVKADTTTVLQKGKDNQDYTVVTPKVISYDEKEFLKVVFAVLVTLTIPLLHPLTSIQATFQKPISFTSAGNKGDKGDKGEPGGNGQNPVGQIIINLGGNTKIDTTTVIEGDGHLAIAIDNRTVPRVNLDSVKTALANLNTNLVRFSTFFGNDKMIGDTAFISSKTDTIRSKLYFVPRRPLNDKVFNK